MNKTRQLVLLYDAVIRFVKQARLAIEEGRFEDRLNLLQKASNIIVGLHGSLDFDKGGEISQILSSFYSAMDIRILAINRTNSLEDCDRIVNEIKMMREAWDKIDQQALATNVLPEAPAEGEAPQGGDFSA